MADYTNYTPEQLQKIYQELPEELQNALFSRDTADVIFDVCERNIASDKVTQVSEYAGYVLLGLLAPQELEKALEEKAALSPDTSVRISKDLNRLVFLPLRSDLEIIYGPLEFGENEVLVKKELSPTAEISRQTAEEKTKKDTYREPAE